MDNCVKYPERLLLRSHLNTGQKQQHTSDQNIEQICTASRAPEYQKLSIVCPRNPLFIYCLFITQNKHTARFTHRNQMDCDIVFQKIVEKNAILLNCPWREFHLRLQSGSSWLSGSSGRCSLLRIPELALFLSTFKKSCFVIFLRRGDLEQIQ